MTANTRLVRSTKLLPFSLCMIGCLILAMPTVYAGSGTVNSNGTIDITVNFRFPPSSTDITNMQNQVITASEVLWDATEGQMRLGQVSMECGTVNEDQADMWVFASSGRAGVGFRCNGSNLGRLGSHINQFLPSSTGNVVAHEFGHLALGLGDEYSEQRRFGNCWGYGRCIEPSDETDRNQCIMQASGNSEFCTPANHDTVTGDGQNCSSMAVPHGCTTNCIYFNHTTGAYETTQETAVCNNQGCWAHLTSNFSFLSQPSGLPTAATPSGHTDPTFTNNCDATDTVLLVLDESGSMNWSTKGDFFEVCGNGADDDSDGTVDEDDCTQTRNQFLQAAARAYINLAQGQDVDAGVVSFSNTATIEASIQEVNSTNVGTLTTAVNGLSPGGGTGIGRALEQSEILFSTVTDPVNQTIFLISDGNNTVGPAPSTVVSGLQSRGIRVFTIATGEASDNTLLTNISGETGGIPLDSRDAGDLVPAFVQQWARYQNTGILVPKLPYMVNREGQFSEVPSEQARSVSNFISGEDAPYSPANPAGMPTNNYFNVLIEEGTENTTFVLAGDSEMGDMSGFGVRALLTDPAGNTYDSEAPPAGLTAQNDDYFLMLTIQAPMAGTWQVEVQPLASADAVQTGNLTVISDNPRVDLFANVDRRVVSNLNVPVDSRMIPIYDTDLIEVESLQATLVQPNGVAVPLTVTDETGLGARFAADTGALAFNGVHEIRVGLQTGTTSVNDPGESLFSIHPVTEEPIPSNTVDVPSLARATVETFSVTGGQGIGTPYGERTEDGGDGNGDVVDECPNDPLKTEPGECGCGNLETPDCEPIEPIQCGQGVPVVIPGMLGFFMVSLVSRRRRR